MAAVGIIVALKGCASRAAAGNGGKDIIHAVLFAHPLQRGAEASITTQVAVLADIEPIGIVGNHGTFRCSRIARGQNVRFCGLPQASFRLGALLEGGQINLRALVDFQGVHHVPALLALRLQLGTILVGCAAVDVGQLIFLCQHGQHQGQQQHGCQNEAQKLLHVGSS